MVGSIISGVINGMYSTFSGIGKAVYEKKQRKRMAKSMEKDLKQMEEQVRMVEDQMNRGLISNEESAKRILSLINAAGENTQAVIQGNLEQSIAQMKETYNLTNEQLEAELDEFNDMVDKDAQKFRRTWNKGYQSMKDVLIRRGLAGSEAMMEMGATREKQLGETEAEFAERKLKAFEDFQLKSRQLHQQLSAQIAGARSTAAIQIAAGMRDVATQQALVEQRRASEQQRLEEQGLANILAGRQEQMLLKSRQRALAAGLDPSAAGTIAKSFGEG